MLGAWCGRGAGTGGEAGEADRRSRDRKKPDEPSESSSCPVRQPMGKAALCGALSAFSAEFMALLQILQLLAVSLEGLTQNNTKQVSIMIAPMAAVHTDAEARGLGACSPRLGAKLSLSDTTLAKSWCAEQCLSP